MGRQDKLYRRLFSHPELVRDLARLLLSAETIAQLDFGQMDRIETTFVTEDMQKRESDLIWRVRFKGREEEWLYLYLLIEFQSSADPWIPLRLMVYVGLLYQELIKQGKVGGRKLPPVLPVVLYHGDEPWRVAKDVSELIELPWPELRAWGPSFRYLLIAEQFEDPQRLLAFHDNLVAAMVALESESPEHYACILQRLDALMPTVSPEVKKVFDDWILALARRFEEPELAKQVQRTLRQGGDYMLLAQRFQDWKKNVRIQGKLEGKLEGERAALRTLLNVRFGALPDWAEERISATDQPEEIERWLTRVLHAKRLEDVFA